MYPGLLPAVRMTHSSGMQRGLSQLSSHTCLGVNPTPTPEGTSPLPQLVPRTAGVAHNKILAKFASGMHKPAQQTVVTLECVPGLMATTPIPKLRQLGGKFGEEIMHALQISTVGDQLFSSLLQQTHQVPSEVL